MQVQASAPLTPVSAPARSFGVGRTVMDIAVPIGAGIVAETLIKGMARRGPVPAVLAGIAGAAGFTAAVEGGVQVARNAISGQALSTGVAARMADGVRSGAISGGVTALSPYIERGITRRFSTLHPIAHVALANATGAAIGGALRTATTAETWQYGAARGLRRVGAMAGLNAATGIVGGVAIKSATHFRLLPKVSWLPYPFNA